MADSKDKLRKAGGYWIADLFGLVEVYGKDDTRFLQAQTTNDVAQLAECSRQSSCLLDRRAHVQAYFDLFRRHESYRIVVEKKQISAILSQLDKFRIADKVEFLDLTSTGEFFALQGPLSRKAVSSGLRQHPGACAFKHDIIDLKLWDIPVHLFRKSVTGEDGYFLWVAKSDSAQFWLKFSAACKALGLVQLDQKEVEVARVEAGLPSFAADFDDGDFLPETGLDETAVSYSKGCFLGQEVLARVKSQGAATRGLVGLLFPPTSRWTFPIDTPIMFKGAEIAKLKTNIYSESFDRVLAFASIKRDYRAPGKELAVTINGQELSIVTTTLPFIQSESLSVRARRLYDQALQLYATSSDSDHEAQAVEKLREALDLEPTMEDGYESLGVVLSKRGELDEAISLMKQLAALNPDSVMAHTNLSVFYLEKGLKEEAEEEKAISMSIRMRLAVREASAKKEEEQKNAQTLEETNQRLAMFQQVLAIDADDLLANYGVGSCHVNLGEFAKAVPFLEKAIAVKPTHTVAYISLGQAYEGLGRADKAIESYTRGIEVAASRGDMTPLKDMQARLEALKNAK